MPFPSALLLLGAALVSGYAFAEHTRATLRLKLKYEEKGRKVAKWSSSVERLMWDTRTTLAFGLVAVRTPVVLGFFYPHGEPNPTLQKIDH